MRSPSGEVTSDSQELRQVEYKQPHKMHSEHQEVAMETGLWSAGNADLEGLEKQ